MKNLPHHSLHAIEDFQRRDLELGAHYPQMRTGLELFLVGMLETAMKFYLPDNGQLFENRDFRPEFFDLFRLPAPVCALEYNANEQLYAKDSGLHFSDKRIALAFDPHRLPEPQLRALLDQMGEPDLSWMPEDAICIISIYASPPSVTELPAETWMSSMGMLVVDLKNDRPIDSRTAQSRFEDDALYHHVHDVLGHKNKTKHGLPGQFELFARASRMLEAMGTPRSEQMKGLVIDLVDEVRATYQFCAAVNCSNVRIGRIEASAALNRKRLRNGRQLYFDCHVLEGDFSAETASTRSGTHASPRMHVRRGHIRRLGERAGYKVIWINATMVGGK